jgi:predicted NAD/FAD-binding protein
VPSPRPTAAVVGAGVSGLTAAYLLSRSHDVTVFEADHRLGGHAHTHTVRSASGGDLAIDSGFIVHNERTYPTLLRLFRDLDVPTQPTEMSMSITCRGCGLSYAGGRGPSGIFAQPWRGADPRFVRMLLDVPRFHRAARALLADVSGDPTWGEFLTAGRYSTYFIRHFAVPLVACVWSSGDGDALTYPARHLFAFLEHHGMLTVTGSPLWRTVTGGSEQYVARLAERLTDIRAGRPIRAVVRSEDAVTVIADDARPEHFDHVVVATHADQALDLLADATPREKEALGSIRYSRNRTILHRDGAVLPRRGRARASWNYALSACDSASSAVQVSYWMNRLHGLHGVAEDYVVTLNAGAATSIAPAAIVAEMTYTHPIFTHEAVAAAGVLREAGGPRLAFAGAHLGWGFHEDGARSGVAAAERFGARW